MRLRPRCANLTELTELTERTEDPLYIFGGTPRRLWFHGIRCRVGLALTSQTPASSPRCLSKEFKVRPGRGLCPYPGRGVNGSTGERAITESN